MAIYPEFKDKVVLITGGAGGIGRATALKMGQNGCKVFIGDILSDYIDRTLEGLQKEGIDASGFVVDITSEESVQAMVDACMEKYGRIDYLVAAAGIYEHTLLKDMTFEQWKKTIDINLTGVFLVTSKVINHMLDRGSGSIVGFSSQAGIRGSALHTHYGASKAGLQGFTKSLMYEIADKGVRINAVAPGVIRSRMTDSVTPEKMERWMASIPMKRMGEPIDVARVIAFLLSDDAEYVVGQTVPVNGGSVVNT